MTAEDNIERMRAMYEARNRGDYDRAVAGFHPEIEFYPPGDQPPYIGVARVRQWMEPDAFENQVIKPLEFTACENKVLVHQLISFRGAGSGIEMEFEAWSVWTFDVGGLVVRVQGWLDREEAEARKAAGLNE